MLTLSHLYFIKGERESIPFTIFIYALCSFLDIATPSSCLLRSLKQKTCRCMRFKIYYSSLKCPNLTQFKPEIREMIILRDFSFLWHISIVFLLCILHLNYSLLAFVPKSTIFDHLRLYFQLASTNTALPIHI